MYRFGGSYLCFAIHGIDMYITLTWFDGSTLAHIGSLLHSEVLINLIGIGWCIGNLILQGFLHIITYIHGDGLATQFYGGYRFFGLFNNQRNSCCWNMCGRMISCSYRHRCGSCFHSLTCLLII